MGAPNDPRLLSTSLVRQEIEFIYRQRGCYRKFPNISKLLAHEATHKKQDGEESPEE